MPTDQMSRFIQHLRRFAQWPQAAGKTDLQLLHDFLDLRDEAAYTISTKYRSSTTKGKRSIERMF